MTIPAGGAAVLALGHLLPIVRLPLELVCVAGLAYAAHRGWGPRRRWLHQRQLQTYLLESETSPTILAALQLAASRIAEEDLTGLAVYMQDGSELRPLLALRTRSLRPQSREQLDAIFDGSDRQVVSTFPVRLPWWSEPVHFLYQPLMVNGRFQGFVVCATGEAPRPACLEAVGGAARDLAQGINDLLAFRDTRSANALDARTGCLRPEPFLDDLQSLIRMAAGRVSVLFFDLDRLSAVNNECGHLAGDRFIALVGEVLRNSVRGSTEDRVCRWGGDEFAAAVVDADPEELGRRLIARLASAVTELPGARELGAGVSYGCAQVGRDDAEIAAIIAREGIDVEFDDNPSLAYALGITKLADERMYTQKRAHHSGPASDLCVIAHLG